MRETPQIGQRDPSASRRAVMYVRMSTEHQKYSPANQARTIEDYANKHRLTIVATYADLGRSGLTIDRRDSLHALIDVVESGCADFRRILVYDVSRWGRFQDIDESAYYEHHCRRHGIIVEYCAEEFLNDGSPFASLAKSIKRMMAADYSRELSKKVFQGQVTLAEMGYRQGAHQGYGLRRLCIGEDGTPKGILGAGEQKALQSEHVILVPGSVAEVRIIRWIYRAYVSRRLSQRTIAKHLNRKNIARPSGRPWCGSAVREILTNEKYVGANVWNRTSSRLGGPVVRNRPEVWVRKDDAFEPIVSRKLQEAAKRRMHSYTRALTNEQMLSALKSFAEKNGTLSVPIINKEWSLPSATAYILRFGSILNAYNLIGYQSRYSYREVGMVRHCRAVAKQIVEEVLALAATTGLTINRTEHWWLLQLVDGPRLSITAAWCQPSQAGTALWPISSRKVLDGDITIIVRLAASDRAPLDYYIIPRREISRLPFSLKGRSGVWAEAYRSDDLSPLLGMASSMAEQPEPS
jgi:DNA invertase Pin-like site-specific DNA recombinase